MSFKCTLTTFNKDLRKRKIIDLYKVARKTENAECFYFVLMWMFEFICSYFYIDTDEVVNIGSLLREFRLSSEVHHLLRAWAKVRNEVAHCLLPFTPKFMEDLAACCTSAEVFNNFEEDRDTFVVIFNDCRNQILKGGESHIFG